MRIIAGERKGLHLSSLKGTATRPTSDKIKESVFNMIGPYFDGGTVVELFGGSGSLSLEALSRGVDEAFIFEKNRKACDVIHSNVEKCRYDDIVHIQQTDARNAVKILQRNGKKVDLLFLDPPYVEKKYYELAQSMVDKELLSDKAIIVCEHDKNTELPEAYGPFKMSKRSIFGNIGITIYRNEVL